MHFSDRLNTTSRRDCPLRQAGAGRTIKKQYRSIGNCEEAIVGFCDMFLGGTVQLLNYTDTTIGARPRQSKGDWSGKLQLDWRPADDLLVYGSISRGIKGGSYNGGAITQFTPGEAQFKGETLVSYESGFKAKLHDVARLNASLFYYDYSDFQTFAQLGPSFLVFNVDARAIGSEAELTITPGGGWNMLLGGAYLDAKQKNVPLRDGTLADQAMTNAPRWSANGLLRKDWTLGRFGISAQTDFSYKGKRSLNAIQSPALQDDGYVIIGARIGVTGNDGQWEIAATAKNLFNTKYRATGFDLSTFTGAVVFTPSPPAWYGVSARFNFR